ncbi:MAG: glycosyltransferase, partial [Clostridia bacterium]
TDPLCDITTQVSKAGLKRYIDIKAVSPHKIRYIPNAVDTTKFRPDKTYRINLRKELELDNYFLWLSVGRLVEAKDYPSLFHAFQKVLRKNRNTRLMIAGDGPLYSTLRNLAIKLEIDQYVLFMGIRDDIPRLMNAADAFVMSSEWEGMPLVLQEAASCALPIVATDVGGNSEVVIDEETGFLVPPKNPEALAQAMLKLMNLPIQQRIAMGIKGRNYMENVYSLDQIVNQWESLYFELINKKQKKHKANTTKY